MAWIEDVSKRKRKVKHFYDASTNQWKAEVSIHDQHYKDDANSWQDIDESIVDDGFDGFDKKCDKTRHSFRIASGGKERWYPRRNVPTEYVEITSIQYYTNKWNNLNLPAVVWKNKGAEWDMPHVYASVTNIWNKVKSDFILKSSSAPTRLRFAISLVGLTLDGWNVMSDSEIVGTIDPITAYYLDATDHHMIPVPSTSVYDGTYVEWSVDTTGATFPIYVDPTFTDGYGGDVETGKDTNMTEGYSLNAYNFGANPTADVRGAGAGTASHILMGFDLSSLDGTSTCDSATLYLYSTTEFVDREFICSIYSIASGNGDWQEGNKSGAVGGAGDCCWDYKDQAGSPTSWAGSAGLNTSGTDYESTAIGSYTIQATDTQGAEHTAALTASRIEGWFGGSNTNYGIIIRDANTPWTKWLIGSSENSTTSLRPKLVVVYTAGGLAVNNGAHSHGAGNVTLGTPDTLSVSEGYHSHSADSVTTTKQSTLSVNNGSHTQSLDSVTLSIPARLRVSWVQLEVPASSSVDLTVNSCEHSHSLSSVTTTKQSTLVVANGAHSHSADSVATTKQSTLVVANGVHSHGASNVILGVQGTLSVADGSHSHNAGNVTTTKQSTLVVANGSHSHSLSSVATTKQSTLVLANGSHSHSANNVETNTQATLNVGNCYHAHFSDSVATTKQSDLVVANGVHSHNVDTVSMSGTGFVSVQNGAHSHGVSNVTLAVTHNLNVASGSHVHQSSIPALTKQSTLVVANGAHAHSAGNVTIASGLSVTPSNVSHAHAASGVSLTQVHVIDPDDGHHNHGEDNIDWGGVAPSVVVVGGGGHSKRERDEEDEEELMELVMGLLDVLDQSI